MFRVTASSISTSLRRAAPIEQHAQPQPTPSTSMKSNRKLTTMTKPMLNKLAAACDRCVHLPASTSLAASVAASIMPVRPRALRRIVFSHRVVTPFMPVRYVSSRPGDRHPHQPQPTHAERHHPEAAVRTRVATHTHPTPAPTSTNLDVVNKGVPLGQQQSYGVSSDQGATGSKMTAGDEIIADVGLSSFIGKVYYTTGVSVAATLAMAYGISAAALIPVAAAGTMMIGSFVISIGSIIYIGMTRPTTQSRQLSHTSNQVALYTDNPLGRKVAYAAFIVGNAAVLSVPIGIVSLINPMIVPAAVIASSAVMGVASAYAYSRPSSSLTSWQGPALGALIGLIGMQIASAVTFYMIGPNMFSGVMMTAYPYATIGLFSVMTAIDSHQAITEYKDGQADHLQHAVGFYLNFLNLLSAFMRIFSRD